MVCLEPESWFGFLPVVLDIVVDVVVVVVVVAGSWFTEVNIND
jgi:hypothetical protein